jgi:amidophosphoribosyltransferase
MFADWTSGGMPRPQRQPHELSSPCASTREDGAIPVHLDSEVILHLIARSRKAKVTDRFIDALRQIEGGYALVSSPTRS